MRIHSGVHGLSYLMLILASCLSGCGQEFTVKPTGSGPDQIFPITKLGTLQLATDQFPSGAETLKLSINVNRSYTDDSSTDTIPQLYGCRLPPRAIREITVNAGEKILPIELRPGAYTVDATFLDWTGGHLYEGYAFFSINRGEENSVIISMEKVELGEVVDGGDVNETEVLPKKISADARLELKKFAGLLGKDRANQQIDLDLLTGIATVNADCLGGEVSKCQGAMAQKMVLLNSEALAQVRAITETVVLKNSVYDICMDPLSNIEISIKKCDECEKGKIYNFSNSGCRKSTHSLTSEQFDKIWGIVSQKRALK